MTVSEVKMFLRRYRDIDLRINSKLEEIQRLRSIAAHITPSQNSGGNSSIGDRVGSAAARIADIDKEINEEIDKLCEVRQEIEDAINSLPHEKQRLCLELRYINGMKFNEIAEKIGYEVRHVYNLHGKALLNLHIILQNNST